MKLPANQNKKISTKKGSSLKETKDKSFPLVAIGASAGGLEAVTELLRNLPSNTGMAFIYVQHLNPNYKSMLTALLSKTTKMKVQEVKNGVLIEPDTFYIIPPNKEMAVTNNHLRLTIRQNDHPVNLPIDSFFSSMAEKHNERVIGIILSGNATDGTRGLKTIKHRRGITFAQDNSAKFSSMPRSAITEGVVDYILSPKEIARKLIYLSKNNYLKYGTIKAGKEDEIENSDPHLKNILHLLYKKAGVDFSHYKMNTIKRRIIRRITMHKIKTLKQYVKLLMQKSEEMDLLYRDLLINVTSFFRDPDAFRFLKTTLLPNMIKSKTSGEALRIWVPACSTGQEAYSIAMLLFDIQDKISIDLPVQIFATDLSAQACDKARNGEYSESELKSVPPQYMQRFFTKSKDGYRIIKSIRDICVFAQHNILSDPPFSRVDFISCCNLLIYLDSTAQKKAIATFHYALNDNGYLMLGKSETIGTSGQLFSTVNKKYRIYSCKKNSGARTIPDITPRFSYTRLLKKNMNMPPPKNKLTSTHSQLGNAIDSILLSRYMPTSVVINHDMEIIEFRGSTELYLRHSSGKASFNILKMARPEFVFELHNAIHNAIKTKETVRKTDIEMKTDSGLRIFSLEVAPLKIEGEEPLLLILFTEQQPVEIYHTKKGKNNSTAKDRRIQKLEGELAAAHANMRSITHDQEIAIEELQSANEEVVSNNEELRTLNEELETSKEEIGSTNEELITTNRELQMRNEQIEELNNYSNAIIATIPNPMLVLDKDLYVRSANKPFCKQFHLNEEILGIKLYELGNNQWKIPGLRKLLEEIIQKDSYINNFEVKHTFSDIGERIILFNARRIIQKNNSEQLILLVMEDITEQANLRISEKKLIDELQIANKSLEDMNAELTSFTYVAGHDLQEPLRKIKNFSSFIIKEEHENISERGKYYFHRMGDAVERMQILIEDLLTYSRTSSKDRKFERTDLNLIIDEVKSGLTEVIKEKQATIRVSKICHANIIRFQFRQLMYNLIGNALKFSNPKKAPYIRIKSSISKGSKLKNKALSPQINYCHITVTDNGIGFDPKYKKRIFEMFQRLHGKNEYSGTGIGLAICKKIIENHNGIISATSQPNKGTRFDIYLPA